MKNYLPAFVAAALLMAWSINLHSQGVLPKTPVDNLRTLKTKNAELIQTQQATLQKLDEMAKAAEQMRFFSKRS